MPSNSDVDDIKKQIRAHTRKPESDVEKQRNIARSADVLSMVVRHACDPAAPENRLAKMTFSVDISRLEAAMIQVSSTSIRAIVREPY